MSLPGMIRFRGVTCDVFRPVVTDAEGGLKNVSWPLLPIVRECRIFLEVISDELAQRVFGRDVQITLRGTALPEPVVQKDDGVVVKSGAYRDQRFRVTAVTPEEHRPGSAHLQLALERTTEVFG